MRESERTIVSGLIVLFLLVWLGFIFHQSPRFAGSLLGGVLGTVGSSLMLVPLAYMAIKRIKPLRSFVTARISMPTLLAIHIYAGVLGPILVILHTGHKYQSHLGIALTGLTIIVVLSGFFGRYVLSQIGNEIRNKHKLLDVLSASYDHMVSDVRRLPRQGGTLTQPVDAPAIPSAAAQKSGTTWADAPGGLSAQRALALSTSMADVEYAIHSNVFFKRVFSLWIKLHIVLSFTLYTLLGLHIWSGIYFGLRWTA